MAKRYRAYTSMISAATAFLAGCLGGPIARAPETAPAVQAPVVPESLTSAPAPSSYYPRVAEAPPAAPPAVEQVRFPVPAPAPQPAPEPARVEPPRVEPPPRPPERPPDAPVVQALRCVLDGKPGAAAEALQPCDPASRELLVALLQLAAPLGDGSFEKASPQETAALLDQLTRLQATLRRRAPLTIEKMCFCRDIRDFGRYAPLPPDYAFQTGSDGLPGELVQVYVEVRNVICRPRGAVYETALKGHVEIHDFRGQTVWQHDFDNKPDRSRTPLQDNYVEFHFNVPAGLAVSSAYTLWVYVKDVEDQGVVKVARRSLDFRVRSSNHTGPIAGASAGAP
jgi:hypothetical protein